MKTAITYFIIFCMTAIYTTVLADTNATDTIEMADTMRSSGKIYVVVAVLTLIFLGISIYLIFIDRKISKLEELISKKQ